MESYIETQVETEIEIPTEIQIEFKSLDLHPQLQASLDEAGFTHASPIQSMTIRPLLEGKDIFAQAETGSGKTGAFVFPILEQILRDEKTGKIEAHETMYAVLSPTRELAQQTHKVFQTFGKKMGIESCCVIGGESIEKQTEQIDKGVHVLVATPGRFADLINRKVVSLAHCKGVVFDEADRLFEMGFQKDIENILKAAPLSRQLIMVSATSNQEVLRTAYKFKSEPLELKLNEDSLLVDHIDHKLAMIDTKEKFPLLVSLLRKKEDAYAIVFCNTQFQTHLVAEWLSVMGFKAKPISGRMQQNKRTKLMEEFRSKAVTVLVCTDVAARGLDIKNVNLVVNYDLPQEAANYVHRIGRTGRAGESGQAISFCAYEDCEFLDPIFELIDDKIEKMDLSDEDFAKDLCKKPYIDRKSLKVVDRDTGKEVKNLKKRTSPEVQPKRERPQRKPRAEKKEFVKDNTPRVDKRFTELTGYGAKSLQVEAMNFLRISDDSLLGFEVLRSGSRKYFIFGARKETYKFFVKPIYKKLLTPFLIGLVESAGLDLSVRVSFKPTSLLVNFSGADEKMLAENDFELLNAFEQLILTYLQSRVVLHRGLKLNVRCFKKNTAKVNTDKNSRNDDLKLTKLAKKMRSKVIETKSSVKLKSLNPKERRIIHQFFQDDKVIKTTSLGDGRFKQIELSLR